MNTELQFTHVYSKMDVNCSKMYGINTENTTTSSDNNDFAEYDRYAFFMDSVLGIIFCAIGFLGNALVLLTLWCERNKSSTSFLMITLACADSLYLAHSILFQSLRSINPYTGALDSYMKAWPYIEPWEFPFGLMAQSVAIWSVTLIGIERYIAVCKPLKSRVYCTINKVRIQLLVVCIVSALLSLPRFFVQRTSFKVDPCTNKTTVFIESYGIGKSMHYSYAYTSVFLLCVYVIPVGLLIYLNTRLIIAVRESYKTKIELQAHRCKKTMESRDKITTMLIVVIAVFITCETPIFINHLIYMKGYMGLPHSYYNVFCNALVTLNSSVNFFIYFLLGRKFRTMLWKKVCGRRLMHPEVVELRESSNSTEPP